MGERLATLTYIVCAVLLLALMAAQAKQIESSDAIVGTLRAPTGRVWQGALGLAGGMRRIAENYRYMVSAREERQRLLDRIQRLEAENRAAQELIHENRRLRELLDLRGEAGFTSGVVANVVADLSAGPLRRAVRVDRGARSGVAAGWVAIARGALAGRVQQVEAERAEVVLISDPDSGVAVRHQLDRFAGILRGGSRGPASFARLEYVPRDQTVAVGDAIVTSGIDGIFPSGLLVGHVRDMAADSPLTWRVGVEIAADIASMEELLLVPPTLTPRARPAAPAKARAEGGR